MCYAGAWLVLYTVDADASLMQTEQGKAKPAMFPSLECVLLDAV